jgi:polyhydroxyalkanoate synthesis regulator phasin
VFKINPGASELTETNAGEILDAFKEAGMWGTAFWKWDYRDADTESFNLISDGNGKINPTKYFGILEDTVETVYGSTDLKNSNEPIRTEQAASVDTEQAASVDTEQAASVDAKSGTEDVKQRNLINELVKTGKFTEVEAKELVTKSIQTETETESVTKTLARNTTLTSNIDGKAVTAGTSDNENNSTANQSSNSNTNPEDYDDLNKLIDDIKNKRVDFEISLNTFKNSEAYKGADEAMQDCIDLAGKIGDNLIDYEIVRCSEDTNFFKNQ